MKTLFDMMIEAGERERLVAQAKAMGLDDTQSRLVVDTLGPAALAGLQRSQTKLSADAARMMQDMTKSWSEAAGAAQPKPTEAPAAPSPASRVFGSEDAATAVADQIARLTGADAGAMRQLVPAFAASLLAQMAVMASLPGMARFDDLPGFEHMREGFREGVANLTKGAPPTPDASAPPSHSPPSPAEMMAPVTAFMQGLTQAMTRAMQTTQAPAEAAPDPEPAPEESADAAQTGVDLQASLGQAAEAQMRAWDAFLNQLAAPPEPDSSSKDDA